MATLPPAQLLEGKAGAPGAVQAPEAFHPHLVLAMTLRGQRQHQRQNAVLRNKPGICFLRGPKATEIRDLKTGSPGTAWLCSSQCFLSFSWRPLTRHPSTPSIWREREHLLHKGPPFHLSCEAFLTKFGFCGHAPGSQSKSLSSQGWQWLG